MRGGPVAGTTTPTMITLVILLMRAFATLNPEPTVEAVMPVGVVAAPRGQAARASA